MNKGFAPGSRAGCVAMLLAAALASGVWSARALAGQDVIRTRPPAAAPADTGGPAAVDDTPVVLTQPRPQSQQDRPAPDGTSVLPSQRIYLSDTDAVAPLDLEAAPRWTQVQIPAFSRTPWPVVGTPLELVRLDLRPQGLCQGYFDPVPQFSVQVETSSLVSIASDIAADTVLLIRLPDGYWACDDDGGPDLNARLLLQLSSLDAPALVYVGFYEGLLAPPDVPVIIDPAPLASR